MESKPGRVWEPSGKRVGHLFGCVSNTLLSATMEVNLIRLVSAVLKTVGTLVRMGFDTSGFREVKLRL